jgi:hypothetical protein
MNIRNVVVASMAVAAWVSTARAQAPAGPPKPAPENEQFKRTSGTWTCQGTTKTPEGQELKYKATWTIKPTLGGHWFAVTYKRSKMGPMPAFEGNATVGFNAAEKKYAFVGFDNLGSWVDLSSEDGAVYSGEGSPMGKKGPVKFTFTPGKDPKGEVNEKLFEVVLDFGAVSSSETCKK